MKIPARRVAAACAALMLSIGLAACGNGAGGGGTSASASAAGQPATLQKAKVKVDSYLSNPPLDIKPLSKTPDNALRVASVTCTVGSCYPGEFPKATQALGWTASEQTYDLAKGPADFVAAVRRALQSRPDALAILFVYPPDVIAKEIQQARSQGVKLIDVASALDAPPQGFIACVYCNATLKAYGGLMGTYTAVDAGGPTEVGVVGDKTIDANRISGKATADEIARVSPDTKVHTINVSYAQTPQANTQVVVATLQRNPGIKYLVFESPDLMGGIDQALSAAGLMGRVKVISTGPTSGDQTMQVQEGMPYAWIGAEGPAYWWVTADIMARNAVGDDFNAVPVTALRVITEDNAERDMFAPTDYQNVFKRAWGVEH
ncbi:sugar ABC transporter substrate-binding protein [Streptomyces plumbiresistens]